VQGAIRNQGDAWNWMLENLKRTVEEHMLIEGQGAPEEDIFISLKNFASVVGRRLGELHVALATPSDDPAFSPIEAGSDAIENWRAGACDQLISALNLLEEMSLSLDPEAAGLAQKLLAQREGLIAAIDRLAQSGQGTLLTRIHGDFHLGQVLVAQGDAYIIDFEGEPLRGLEERRAKTSSLRDVAGLLRSLDYVAVTVAAPDDDVPSQQFREVRTALLDRFHVEARTAFLDSYWEIVTEAPHLGYSDDRQDLLLDLFLLEKAAYEIHYEAANRPKWLAIPLRGLSRIADRLVEAGNGEHE
jgi:maltose alpha-D-glucosyltransferase / alpha-amylase